jgi:alpha-tubulin suppressor-like RCC1 family protein
LFSRDTLEKILGKPSEDLGNLESTRVCTHVLVLTKEGKVLGWGNKGESQLGLGEAFSADSVRTPVQIPLPEEISEIASGLRFSMFLSKTGNLYTCGEDSQGQLRLGDTKDSLYPTLVPLKGVVSLVCGCSNCLALTQDGSLFSWGDNTYFQLGHKISGIEKKIIDSDNIFAKHVPVLGLVNIIFSESVVWMGVGPHESMVLTENGNLYSWGRFAFLGHGTTGL